MCVPELDSPSIFGALLDPERGGRYVLEPAVSYTATRSYLPDTNVLKTVYETADGQVAVIDAVTLDSSLAIPWRELVRRVDGVAGQVPMRWRLEPRFDYGQRAATFARVENGLVARDQHLWLAVRTWDAGIPEVQEGAVQGSFWAEEGSSALLTLQAGTATIVPLSGRVGVERRLEETAGVWRRWVSRHHYDGPWRTAVERSLLAIRLLADGRSGAIAAAGTSSLPEAIGGARNFDYRYGWVRDLSFTLDALLAVGMDELTHAALNWLLHTIGHTHPRIDPVYALNGGVVRSQSQLPLTGYRGTRPVLLGNQAGSQLQLGGWGDLVETVWAYVDHGHRLAPDAGEEIADSVSLLCRLWESEDAGLWELGDRAHYTTSKLGCWTAFDRSVALAERGVLPSRHLREWRRERDRVAAFIDQHLFSAQRGTYVMKAGSQALDCGTLLAARRGYGDPTGERLRGTIDAIWSELHAGGPLFYRYSGMQEQENAFLACSFWMVETMALAGQLKKAAELMDAAVGAANDLGLYSEEMEPSSRAMRGNYPQALTHLSLINAATILEQQDEERGREAKTSKAFAGA
jgi:GH15 family glucan-1,4-alpha-glucosidase